MTIISMRPAGRPASPPKPISDPSSSKQPRLSIKLRISVCVNAIMAELSLLPALNKLFSSSRAIRKDGWEFRDSSPKQQQQDLPDDQTGEMKFLQIENNFTLRRNSQEEVDDFDSLFSHITTIFKSNRFRRMCGKDKLVLISWALYDTREPVHLQMSRWVLPPPSHPICLPIQNLELFLYNAVSIKMKQQDASHDPCGIGATLGCIEDRLWEQKAAYGTLVDALDALKNSESRDSRELDPTHVQSHINQAISSLETVDKSLTSLLCLIDNRVGRYPAIKGRWKLLKKLRAFLRGPLMAIDIDDPALEANKVAARRALGTLYRTVPVLAIHVRLHDPDVRAELKQACENAGSGFEKREMPNKLAILPSQLENSRKRAEQMKRVRQAYENCHQTIVDEVELVLKRIGQQNMSLKAGRRFGGLGRSFRVPPKPCRMVIEAEDLDGSESPDEFEEWDEKN